ncbi:unnamed protein product [Linum trigynum]|uniref:Transmembrane protein n=1 Tax=Linum trigynum TaxID=586398 RepID=A0AAV2GB00_9ROSI
MLTVDLSPLQQPLSVQNLASPRLAEPIGIHVACGLSMIVVVVMARVTVAVAVAVVMMMRILFCLIQLLLDVVWYGLLFSLSK